MSLWSYGNANAGNLTLSLLYATVLTLSAGSIGGAGLSGDSILNNYPIVNSYWGYGSQNISFGAYDNPDLFQILRKDGQGSRLQYNPGNGNLVVTSLNVNGPTSAAGGNFYVAGNGSIASASPGSPVNEYTVSGLPSAAAWSGKYTKVSNPAAGKSYGVRSNGTNWLYEGDQSIAA